MCVSVMLVAETEEALHICLQYPDFRSHTDNETLSSTPCYDCHVALIERFTKMWSRTAGLCLVWCAPCLTQNLEDINVYNNFEYVADTFRCVSRRTLVEVFLAQAQQKSHIFMSSFILRPVYS